MMSLSILGSQLRFGSIYDVDREFIVYVSDKLLRLYLGGEPTIFNEY